MAVATSAALLGSRVHGSERAHQTRMAAYGDFESMGWDVRLWDRSIRGRRTGSLDRNGIAVAVSQHDLAMSKTFSPSHSPRISSRGIFPNASITQALSTRDGAESGSCLQPTAQFPAGVCCGCILAACAKVRFNTASIIDS